VFASGNRALRRAAVESLQQRLDRIALHKEHGLRVSVLASGVELAGEIGSEAARDGAGLVLHGGAVAGLLDTAMTLAMVSVTDASWMTVNLRVDYLRATRVGLVSATGSVVKAGRSLGWARGELCDGEGVLCAIGIATLALER